MQPSTSHTNGTASPLPKKFDSIESSVAAFARGEFIIVLDSTSRENEGDLIIAASAITPEKMAFMVRYTSGLICAPLTAARAQKLELPQMVTSNEDPNRTAYTVSVDASEGVTTGISASDRSLTCKLLADEGATAETFRRPGHVFPLRARAGGVRERAGHTEAAVDFCRLAGLPEVGIICELIEDGVPVEEEGRKATEMKEPGMMRRDACLEFGRRWGLKVCTIEDLVEYVEKEEGKLGKLLNGVH